MPRLLPLVVVLLLVLGAAPVVAQTGPLPGGPQSEHVRAGIAHYNKAFYELTPKLRGEEARAEFALAVAAFEREAAANPSSAEAHRYLGRIHALQGQAKKAGEHYDTLSLLEPLNVDACVLAALAYVDAKEYAEARLRLEEGKHRTSDPTAIARLDEYLARLDALKR